PPLEVTEPLLDIWRPAVAVDTKGRVTVAWSQQVNDNWDIYYRQYTPPAKSGEKGTWSDIVRLTKEPGTDFNVVAAADSQGSVWLAWQAWRKGHFQILAAEVKDNVAGAAKVLSQTEANHWNPAIAADSRGNVYVAWDTYNQDNYDVLLHRI